MSVLGDWPCKRFAQVSSTMIEDVHCELLFPISS